MADTFDPVLRRLVRPFNGDAPTPVMQPAMADTGVPPVMPVSSPAVTRLPTDRDLSRQNTARDTTELNRLVQTGSGVSQIDSKPLRVGARILDTLGSVLAPQITRFVPGSTLHHYDDLNRQQARVQGDLGIEHQQASDALLDAQPALKQAALENKTLQLQNQQEHWQRFEDVQRERAENQLRSHGYKHDETGKVVPLAYEELSSQQQAVEDLKHAQQEEAEANAALKKAQNDPSSPAYQLAKSRVDVARQNAATAYGRLGLAAQNTAMRRETMDANLYGVGKDGQPLVGAPQIVDENGNTQTVGLRAASTAIKQQKAVGTFNDLIGSVKHTSDALEELHRSGGAFNDAAVIAALQDPHSMVGKYVQGKLVRGNLNDQQINAIAAVNQLREQAGILRQSTGGGVSEAQQSRILETLPAAGDSPQIVRRKLAELYGVIQRLSPAVTNVSGGLSVSGRKPSAPARPAAGKSDPLGLF